MIYEGEEKLKRQAEERQEIFWCWRTGFILPIRMTTV